MCISLSVSEWEKEKQREREKKTLWDAVARLEKDRWEDNAGRAEEEVRRKDAISFWGRVDISLSGQLTLQR